MSDKKMLHERLSNGLEEANNSGDDRCRLVTKRGVSFIGVEFASAIKNEIERDYISREEHEAAMRELAETQRGGAHHIIKAYAEPHGMPMQDGENITQWLDHWFIPRPRFEDGEPVQFGDKVEGCDGKVKSFLLYEDGSGIAYGVKDSFYKDPFKGAIIDYCHAIRPTTKVYDADGVECKPGHEMWRALDCEDSRFFIASIAPLPGESADDPDALVLWGEDGMWRAPKACTHERPVFDAEGERIRKGDTVWHVGDVSRGTVVGIIIDNTWHGYPVKVAWDKGDEGFYPGDALTHREPDSIEKLRDDIIKNAPNSPALFTIKSWADRLTALIERGA